MRVSISIVVLLLVSFSLLTAYEAANIWKYRDDSGMLYTVPPGETFWLYGMMFQSDRTSSSLLVNGQPFWRDGPETDSWGMNFDPPIRFASGSVFSVDVFQASVMIYGYEGKSNSEGMGFYLDSTEEDIKLVQQSSQ